MSGPPSFVDTPSLGIAFEETGPVDGTVVVLLHGFPYDVRQYDELRAQIAALNLRVITPYLRGFGPTRYASDAVVRSGQQAALGKDVLDLLEALGIGKAILVGYDWGGRAACVAAALWPERVDSLLSVVGYSIQDIAASAVTPQSAEQEHQFWYQWYMQTERGRLGFERNRKELAKLLWRLWSPHWRFSEAAFEQTALSFENPNFVATVIHAYRHRYANAPGDPALEQLEGRLAEKPMIHVPTMVLHGEDDRVEPPSTSAGQEQLFTSHYERRLLRGVGHRVPAEAPADMSQAIRDLLDLL